MRVEPSWMRLLSSFIKEAPESSCLSTTWGHRRQSSMDQEGSPFQTLILLEPRPSTSQSPELGEITCHFCKNTQTATWHKIHWKRLKQPVISFFQVSLDCGDTILKINSFFGNIGRNCYVIAKEQDNIKNTLVFLLTSKTWSSKVYNADPGQRTTAVN